MGKVTRDAPWIVPFERNPRFTGRESQLTNLEAMLSVRSQTTKIAIYGLGGVGKTQLAIEFVHRVRTEDENVSVIWIPATNMESLEQSYRDVAQQLGISESEDHKTDVKKLVQQYLSKESASQWVLVFDNADDIDMWTSKSKRGPGRLIDYLPKSKRGTIIFTTRDRKTAVKLAEQNIVEVQEMDEDMATQLLQNCLVNNELVNEHQDTSELLSQLTYLPLAIVQAAAYVNENGMELADYLSLLKEQEDDVVNLLSKDFEANCNYDNVKGPVATTWLISFEQIRCRDPLAADYLSFIACVDPKDVPQSLLPPPTSRMKGMEAIGTLKAYSFIVGRRTDSAIDVHRLVHLATRNWLRKEELLAQWTEKAIVRLEEVFPDDNYRNRSVWRAYLPHARMALESDIGDRNLENRIHLMWRYGTCLYRDGRWKEAEEVFVQAMETFKSVLEPEHPSTLTSMANLASTYRNQGRWKEAEELEVQVMETRKRVLGAEHPDTLTSMNNIAHTWKEQGRTMDAVELMKQCIGLRTKVLGAEHPFTLSSSETLIEWETETLRLMDASDNVLGSNDADR